MSDQDRISEVGNTGAGTTYEEPLLFELSREGRAGYSLPELDVPRVLPEEILPEGSVREDLKTLPELSEVEIVRHFTRLSTWNAAVDFGLYPLGSCTMKYNPKINEKIARIPGFLLAHPRQPDALLQGFLELCYELESQLAAISGMDRVTLQPAAGAQGELAGIMMIRAYHEARDEQRTKIIIPDTAHGTNPASAALNGYKVVEVPSSDEGILSPEAVAGAMDDDVAGIMVTNPNTLGFFEEHMTAISEIVHARGGLVYGDGANLNALMGVARPGDLGIDVMHFNLHKTFSTPHGGGGPGSGPVGVKNLLAPHLPTPVIQKEVGAEGPQFRLENDLPHSIGRLHGNFGNAGMFVRAYTYLRSLGPEGLKHCSEMAVLNANYILARLRGTPYRIPFDRTVMHECIVSDAELSETGVTTADIAKRLIDHGYHPPTTYFPLIVPGALMIEPTETESREGLDRFVDALLSIAEEAKTDPDTVRTAPHHTRRSRMDETKAARHPVLKWTPEPPT